MNRLSDLLDSQATLLLDGAMGTMLIAAGLMIGDPPEAWNLTHPDQVGAVHRAYIQAGSRVILTNSFGGTRFRLGRHQLQDQVSEVNRAAAEIARSEADGVSSASGYTIVVAGSIGPTGELLVPVGKLSFEEARDAFSEQASALASGGVDVLWIETMSDLNEVKAAIEGARAVSDLPVVVTMTFDTHGRTMMGIKPAKAIEALKDYDLLAVGANCGAGPDELESTIEAMRAANPDLILVAKANAGLPKRVNQEIVYDGSPEIMADYAVKVKKLGARLIGACCGSTPAHIKAMADALA